MIRAYQTVCAEAIERWGGHLAKYMGDGVMAYFGYPAAHEDDAARAVRAGLDMLAAVEKLDSTLGRERGVSLRVRIGAQTGLVIAGEMGAGANPELQAVVGETPNVAARLEALAAPGTMAIGLPTARLVEDLFELASLGRVEIRGLTQAVGAWRVVRERTVEGRFEARAARGLTSLVGRQAELALLLQRWSQACEGEPRVVLLSGEAGIGKSRTLRAFRDSIDAESHSRVLYYCSPYHQNSAFWPAVEQLQRALRFEPGDAPQARLAKLDAALAELGLRDKSHAPALATLLGLPAAFAEELSSQQVKKRTLDALTAMLGAMARQQPVLMVVEDGHWLDPSTLELMQRLVEQPPDGAFMLLLTGRPEFRPAWGRWPHFQPLALDRLSRRERAAMVTQVAGGKPLPEAVLDQIIAKTDGIPLFVEELTKTVIESGLLRDAGDRYALDDPLPPLAIPSTLQDSLMARLDRLTPTKDVAQIGAAIGRSFEYRLIAAVAPMQEKTLVDGLNQLIAAELLFARGEPPEATYEFKHALVQDAAYASLLKARRQHLHAAIARELKRTGSAPEVLAHHYQEAGLADEAVSCWEAAGHNALSNSAAVEASASFRSALDLLALRHQRDRRRELDILLPMGQALIGAVGGAAAPTREAFQRARDLAEELEDFAALRLATYGLFIALGIGARLSAATSLAEDFRRRAHQRGDASDEMISCRVLGTVHYLAGNLVASEAELRRTMELARVGPLGAGSVSGFAHDPKITAVATLTHVLWALGRAEEAVALFEQSLRVAHADANANTIAMATLWAAMLGVLLRSPEHAIRHASELTAYSTDRGMRFWAACAGFTLGAAMAERGDGEPALAQLRPAVEEFTRQGARQHEPFFECALARAHANLGEVEAAHLHYDRALRSAADTGQRFYEPEIRRQLGQLALQRDSDGESAAAHFDAALSLARAQGSKAFELRVACATATMLQLENKFSEARGLLEPIYNWFKEGNETVDVLEAKCLLAKAD